LKRPGRDIWILPVTAAGVVLVDQYSKYLVATRLREGQSWDLAPWLAPIFHITHVTNTGAAFGLFRGWGGFFIVVAIVVIAVILIYSRQLPAGPRLTRVALGLQLGGAVGNNLVDRLRQGFVVDFIDLNFWPMREWPVFNLADTSIVTGVTVLALLMVREEWLAWKNKQAAQDDG
jgi:signal peptidase II